MYRLAINGYGRIGRSVLRALHASPFRADMQIVAINEPADSETICHLTRFDSTHGRFAGTVALQDEQLIIDQQAIALSHHTQVSDIRWPDVDLVLECSGAFSDRATAEQHLQAGARKVLFSQPAHADVDLTVVYGVNHQQLTATDTILSNASCTTNACVAILQLLHQHYGIISGASTTIHSAMNDQPVIDAYHHTDLRKTRSASCSMIPVDTDLARGIERLLPELTGRLTAQAIRIPTMNVSALDISLVLEKNTDLTHVNQLLCHYAQTQARIVSYNQEPLASVDFNHDSHSAIIDATQTRVSRDGHLLKVFIWFDNEWGDANRMLDVAHYLRGLSL